MTPFTQLRRHRTRIGRVVLTAFVTGWMALAWQPCVHAFEGMQAQEASAQEVEHCLHCPPKVQAEQAPAACCDEADAAAPCTDVDQSATEARSAVKLQLPVVVTAGLHDEVFVAASRAVFLPVQGDASRRAPPRSIYLTFGVLLN